MIEAAWLFQQMWQPKRGCIFRSGGGLDLQVSILAEGTRRFVRSLFRLKKQMLFVFVLCLLDMYPFSKVLDHKFLVVIIVLDVPVVVMNFANGHFCFWLTVMYHYN